MACYKLVFNLRDNIPTLNVILVGITIQFCNKKSCQIGGTAAVSMSSCREDANLRHFNLIPDGNGHHDVGVGHDDDWDNVLDA